MIGLKRATVYLLTILVLSASTLPSFVLAEGEVQQGTWYNPTSDQFLDKVSNASDNEIFGERYTFAQVSWIIHSIFYLLGGPIANCANETDKAGCIKDALTSGDTGVILPVAMMVDTMSTNKPLSGVDYVAGKLEKFEIIDTANAQESGFGYSTSLSLVQPIWTGVRDASYSLVIFAILILAFMVMLRAKISPQAAVTVQSALPRVALGLVLITFSYAIAGFMIDLVFVLQGLVAGVLVSADLSSGSAISNFQAMNSVWVSTFTYVISVIMVLMPLFAIGGGVSGAAALLTTGPIALGVMVASVILLIILFIMMIIALIRIFWLQLKTSVAIIILVIVSPLIMLIGIVRPGTIQRWFRGMAAQLSVFFMISILIMLAHLILYSTNDMSWGRDLLIGITGVNSFSINYDDSLISGTGSLPTNFGLGGVGLTGIFISLGVIFSIPKMATMARDAISKPGPSPFDSVNTMTGGVSGAATGVAGAGWMATKRGVGEGVKSAFVDPKVEAIRNRLARRRGGEGEGGTRGIDSSR